MSNIMHSRIADYITDLDRQYQTGTATEHTHRPALQKLLENLMPELIVTNEPKRIECGAPDYIITNNDIPVGYVEAKDIGTDLNSKAHKEQFNRYLESLDNLIITDYLKFRWYQHGELTEEVVLGKLKGGKVVPDTAEFEKFIEIIRCFSRFQGQGIKDAEHLSHVMATKAKLLANAIEQALIADEESQMRSAFSGQLEGFRKVLIHDIGIRDFSDIYAQTVAYGMFAARLNDTTNAVFTRGKAATLVPHSNPFLRKLFQYIAGYDLDARINWVVDALADLFNYADIPAIRVEFAQQDHDPIVHFYETFLAKYDPNLRKSRGVWYTPQPVVRFIVQAFDDILKKEFGLERGLADNSTVTLPIQDGQQECHKVQILDPAAGTGTFLAEVINTIHRTYFAQQQGMWTLYCKEHLIPRLNGFEILMASYAMAHLKLDMILKETGFTNKDDTRLQVFLTNTLEEAPEQVPQLFLAEWLSQEAEAARKVKRDVPVMVVMGNPPYNVSTQNKNDWIDGLIADYKKEPETGKKLSEQKLNLDDDYVKFIRYGQMLVEKTETGILAYITNHGFLDNPSFRGMRWSLLQSFDKIYVLNLHGSTTRNETVPEGIKDENVFDIKIGTSVIIGIKTGKKAPGQRATIFHAELFGQRSKKFGFLQKRRIDSIKWKELAPNMPFCFFVPKSFLYQGEYQMGFSITELFGVYGNAIKTDRDSLFIDWNKEILGNRIQKLLSGKYDEQFAEDYNVNDSGSYKLTSIIKNKKFDPRNVMPIQYRPFDNRFIYYQRGLTSRPAHSVMKHFLAGENIGLVLSRQFGSKKHFICFMVNTLIEISSQPFAPYSVFPLYLYPDADALLENEKRTPNLNAAIVQRFVKWTELRFVEEKEEATDTFAPIDILDYVYAWLHRPAYRERYKEFLKIDFPRLPFPEDVKKFWRWVQVGAKLRRLHLMEGVEPLPDLANFPIAGTNEIETLRYTDGKVYVNSTQYFDHVPSEAWNFYIGGYQPAQKWLKDRKGQTLDFDDILHYQKIIRVLKETIETMDEIDAV